MRIVDNHLNKKILRLNMGGFVRAYTNGTMDIRKKEVNSYIHIGPAPSFGMGRLYCLELNM